MKLGHRFGLAPRRTTFAVTLGLVLSLGLVACGSDEQSEGTIRYIGSPAPDPINVVEPVAIAAGIFEDEGIKVEYSAGKSLPEMAAAMLGGSADFGYLGMSAVAPLMEQGECFSFLSANQAVTYRLIAQPSLGLEHAEDGYPESVQDLKGQKVGTVTLGGIQSAMLNEMLGSAGLKAEDIKGIAVGSLATQVPSFQNKQIDILMSSPGAEQLIGEGNFELMFDFMNDESLPGHGVIQTFTGTTCENAEKNPELVRSYCRAQAKAHQYFQDSANQEALIAEQAKKSGLDLEKAESVWNQYKGVWGSAEITEEVWEKQTIALPPGVELPSYDKHVNQDCQEAIREVEQG